ncbi:MAG: outer membrane protein assembly factor BamA [Planctomycetota bacterium]|nr:outer membrane protein assembly factor BamA [Planctomycetota bacterium]
MRSTVHGRVATGLLALTLSLGAMSAPTFAQGVEVAHRPVAEIRVEGLKQVAEKLVRNQIRLNVGEPYDARVVQEDIVRITHLGRFGSVRARVEPKADGTVVLSYQVEEQPLLTFVQTVGNKAITDQELLDLVRLRAGDPIDQFLIDRGIQEIKRAYQKKGYFVTDVVVDKDMLNESGVLLYRVREGPQPRVRGLRFEGNVVFTDDQLRSKIKSKTYIWILRKGEMNREQLDTDATLVRDFYRDRGYLDAEVGRRIDLSPDQKNAVVVFVVHEGLRYTVDKIRIDGVQLFQREQILEAVPLKVGDIFSTDRLKKSQEAILNQYGDLGFIEAKVEVERLFHENEPMVDLQVKVSEGMPYLVNKMSVKGNQLTQEKVVERQYRKLRPGERFVRSGIAETEQRLNESSLFSEAKVSIQGDASQESRDVITEIKERNTGSLSFGAGVSSDAGVIGAIDLVQRNFDIADVPESAGEFFTGKSFRGAGQYFALSLQPGNQTSRYSVTFREPYLLDSDFFLDSSLFYFTRDRDQYQEQRIGGTVALGQRFGDVWSASLRARGELIDISDVQSSAPVDVFDVQGNSAITSLGFFVTRNTTDSRIFPTHGNRWEVGVSRAGLLGGDYDFNMISSDFRQYWTIDEDFFGRRTVLSLRQEIGQIFDGDVPVFERLYAGGQRSFRGFSYRGAGPRGIRFDTKALGSDPIGGSFLFLLGLEYNFPVFQDIVRVVFFTDTGTVQKETGLDQYRVSIGTGVRIKIPFLGQAPFALDVAVPVMKQKGDDVQYFSFDLAVPF